MEVSVGSRKVMLSGSVVVMSDEPVMFSLAAGFVVVIRFEHTDAVGEKQCKAVVENNQLHITYVNYDDPVFTTNRESMLLGSINGNKILFNVAFSYVGDRANHSRVIHYTFLEEIVAEGK